MKLKKSKPLKTSKDLGKTSWTNFYLILDEDGKPILDEKKGKKSPMIFHKTQIKRAMLEVPNGYKKIRADKFISYSKNKIKES